MKPKRPDSAKTQFTKLTQDSDSLKKDLNASKFSQTFSSGVNSNSQRTDDFRQYVAEKDRDPRFKHLKHKLQVIEEKTSQPAASKTNFKPFEKKKEKTVEKNSGRKVQEVVEKVQKADEQLNLSRGFAQKNKEKMNSLKMAPIQKQQQQKIKQTLKPKLKFDAFKINKPGQKRQSKKAQQVEVKKESPKKIEKPAAQPLTQQQKKKLEQKLKKQYQESQLRDIQRFVNDIQARNINYFPNNYDRVVNSTVTNNAQDLQKIDLRNFLDEPTQEDYEQLKAKIRNMDDELETSKMEQSIDLQSLIGDKSETQEFTNEQQKSLYASMSSSQIKKRNAFITQIISGKISKKQIEQIEKMQKTSLKMYKIEREKDEQEVQFSQINLVKRQSNRLMERNRIQASGQLYRDCDYLSQEHQQRLQALLNGELEESPFECDDLERMKRRRIDEGIRMYRQLSGCQQQKLQAASEDHLPKDPELRKQAEKKVLRQKITNVNKRLSEVDKIDVSKAKIQALIKKFEHTRASSNLSSTLIQQQQKFKEQIRRLQELEGMIQNFTNKENTDDIFKEIEASYKQLQAQIQRYAQMDEQQMKKQQKKRLQQKLRQVQAIQKESNDLESQINQIQKIKRQVQFSLASFDRMQAVQIPDISCENFNEGQTLEDIDAIIQRKLKLYGNHPLQQNNQ